MDFELNADQEALQEGVRKLCTGRFPMERVRALVDDGGVDRDLWRDLADAGVFSLCLPESDGGAGLGHAEAVLVFEELGRALVPGPLAATHLAAGRVDAAVVGAIEREREATVAHLEALDVLVAIDDAGLWAIEPRTLDAQAVIDPLDPLTPSKMKAAGHGKSLTSGEPSVSAEGAAISLRLRQPVSGCC